MHRYSISQDQPDPHYSTLKSMHNRIDSYTQKLQSVFGTNSTTAAFEGGYSSQPASQNPHNPHPKSTRTITSNASHTSKAFLRTAGRGEFGQGQGRGSLIHKETPYTLCNQAKTAEAVRRAEALCEGRLKTVQKKIEQVHRANVEYTERQASPPSSSLRTNPFSIPIQEQLSFKKFRQNPGQDVRIPASILDYPHTDRYQRNHSRQDRRQEDNIEATSVISGRAGPGSVRSCQQDLLVSRRNRVNGVEDDYLVHRPAQSDPRINRDYLRSRRTGSLLEGEEGEREGGRDTVPVGFPTHSRRPTVQCRVGD